MVLNLLFLNQFNKFTHNDKALKPNKISAKQKKFLLQDLIESIKICVEKIKTSGYDKKN